MTLADRHADPEHEIAYHELCQLLRRHADKMTPADILAIAANMVGKLIALQDQRAGSKAEIMELIASNIERGNQQIIEALMQTKGTA